MKTMGGTSHVLLAGGLTFILAFALVGHASAQNAVFTDRAAFEAAAGSFPVLLENFDAFVGGQEVSQLFGGLVTFPSPVPTVFYGNWNALGTGGEFSGGAIIPEPRFGGQPLVLSFSSPVFGVGGNAFDDFDGTPFVNVITLTVTTSLGFTFSVSETFPNVGDTGFLGATSSEGIVKAVFSIDNTDGNLEVDLLSVVPKPAAAPGVLWLGSNSDYPGLNVTETDTLGTGLQSIPVHPCPAPSLSSLCAVTGIAYDGANLYFGRISGVIEKRTADGQTVLGTLEVPVAGQGINTCCALDLAWDTHRERLWRLDFSKLLRIDPVTGHYDVFPLPPNLAGWGLAYDSGRDLLYGWVCPVSTAAFCDTNEGDLLKFDPHTGAVLGTLFHTSRWIVGLGYDRLTDTLWAIDNVSNSDYQTKNLTLTGAVLSSFARRAAGLEFIAPAPHATYVHCGRYGLGFPVSGHVVLANDLNCVDVDGLRVDADNTTIDLNGHTIRCTGSGYLGSCQGRGPVGIATGGRSNVLIMGPGTIDGFATGVVVSTGASVSVRDLTVTGPASPGAGSNPRPNTTTGISVYSTRCPNAVTIQDNDVSNQAKAIYVFRADCVTVKSNHVHDNNTDPLTAVLSRGILLEGASNNVVSHNLVERNGENAAESGSDFSAAGIALRNAGVFATSNNLVSQNTVSENCGDGILLVGDGFGAVSSNTIVGNEARHNGVSSLGGQCFGPPQATFFDLAVREQFPNAVINNTWTRNNHCNTQGPAGSPIPDGVCNPGE